MNDDFDWWEHCQPKRHNQHSLHESWSEVLRKQTDRKVKVQKKQAKANRNNMKRKRKRMTR